MRGVVHGTGLIGTSVALALRAQGWTVEGWDPDPGALAGALEREAINTAAEGPGQGVAEADLLVLAGPPAATMATLRELSTSVLVTDVAGVKTPIVMAGRHLPHFVGGHPMAGREQSGPASATASLFRGATWVLTDDHADPEDLDRLGSLVASFGAQPLTMTAADHDRAVAKVSHLPHLLAASLLRLAQADATAFQLAAGSFRDLTRVAASDPGWWAEVLIANSGSVSEAIEALEEMLDEWKKSVISKGGPVIAAALNESREARSRLAPPVAQARVLLVDEPGELARVGRALEISGVDVRDLELRHALHGGAGVLTLSVRPLELKRLHQALVEEGFSPE